MRFALACAASALLLGACSDHDSTHLPAASRKDFPDIDLIAQRARQTSAADGDARPAGVAIVKSTLNAVFGQVPSNDPARSREMYFIRIDGNFTNCRSCSRLPGATFGPTRWLFFDWDPQRPGVTDFGYGSAPHLEEFGTVYAVDLTRASST